MDAQGGFGSIWNVVVHVDLHLGDVESEQKKKEIMNIKRITKKKLLWKRIEGLEGRLI